MVGNVAPRGPALAAGIMSGDVLLALDGVTLTGPDIAPILARHRPGDRVPVRLRRGAAEMEVEVVLGGEGNLRWEVVPVAEPTERQLRLREEWLASSVGR
jgi:predicted metalloprotease with PDZ domain